MKIKSRRRAGALALAAFLASSAVGFAGCGTTASTGSPESANADSTAAATSAAAVTTAAATSTVAWNTCPRDRTDCAYPGECGRYTDSNDDGICDLSQDDPSGAASTITLAFTGTGDDRTGYCPLGPCGVCGICTALSA